MQHSSEDISPSNYGKFSALLKPKGGEYTVTDDSSGSSFPKHVDIPFNGTKGTSNGPWKLLSGSNVRHISSDVSLFSTSLPVLPHEKLNINSKGHACQSIDDISCTPNKLDPLEDLEYQGSGTFLPDDDELLSGIMDNFQIGLPDQMDDFEEYDVFGMEIESGLSNDMSKISLSEDGVGNGHYVFPNGVGTVAGEHPYGEHPSRTLFVRNINSNVEDLELRALFEQYGDIRALYTACKHRGFVMISYYDIRDARTAMKALQNKPLRRRKLDIHFSIPKDNPSDKDMNQGTLVVFNLDPSVSNDDLRQIFGVYGEVKEIRETPHKRHHKFIEFYDVRAAEAALRSLNRSDIAGKRIKLEPSRPGGARRNIMVNPSQEFELDDSLNFRHQLSSSVASSPPGSWPQYGSPIERSSFGNSLGYGSMSPSMGNNFSGSLNSLLHPRLSNSPKMAPIGNGRASHLEHKFTDLNSNHNSPFPQSHSFPEGKLDPIETLSGSQFLWGSPVPNQQRNNSNSFTSNGQFQGLPYGNRPPVGTSHHLPRHHVGSAPSNVPMERHFGFFNDSSERSVVNQMGFRGLGIGHNESNFGRVNGHFPANLKMMPPSRLSPVFLDNNNYFPGLRPTGFEGFDHSWSQRVENSSNIMDNKKQFQLNLEKIINGEDKRTTLMIKNIPNKYTSKMLMAVIDENYRGTYDFLYLPIDFKNKCNVGYAFINMVSPSHIIPFYKVFNGKRWEKFNSEKVASLAYARIQGKAALVAHFQNSSLMNEDKRCRPIVFHSDGSEASDQGCPPSNSLNIQLHQAYPEDSKGCFLGTSPHENPNNS